MMMMMLMVCDCANDSLEGYDEWRLAKVHASMHTLCQLRQQCTNVIYTCEMVYLLREHRLTLIELLAAHVRR